MDLKELDYTFPPELIAQYPLENRADSRMMVVNRSQKQFSHQNFKDIVDYFSEGDVLVLNNSKVFPCRLLTRKKTGGLVECFLLRETKPLIWECLLSSSKKIAEKTLLIFSGELSGTLIEADDPARPTRQICLSYTGDLISILEKIGKIPLPPYIKREARCDLDQKRYQTVYAQSVGSVAAPTAGFHFTEEILESLKKKGVQIVFVTLHVGIGTFLPIRAEKVEAHPMHPEFFEIPNETKEIILKAKHEGKSVTAVGTTTVRALESAWDKEYTSQFIYPPYSFKVIDRLLTNFHQPKSTLLALVSAFAGLNLIKDAYGEAILKRYRLFSYGDCMWIM